MPVKLYTYTCRVCGDTVIMPKALIQWLDEKATTTPTWVCPLNKDKPHRIEF